MKTLFIGGQEDGNWHDIPEDRDYWRIPEKIQLSFRHGDMPSVSDEMMIYTYSRQILANKEGKKYSVMVDDMNDDCLIKILLQGYKSDD